MSWSPDGAEERVTELLRVWHARLIHESAKDTSAPQTSYSPDHVIHVLRTLADGSILYVQHDMRAGYTDTKRALCDKDLDPTTLLPSKFGDIDLWRRPGWCWTKPGDDVRHVADEPRHAVLAEIRACLGFDLIQHPPGTAYNAEYYLQWEHWLTTIHPTLPT